MAFKATLRFAGLCANVPNESLDKEPTRLWVVMPDAREPSKPSICKHYPGIFVNAARLADSDKAQVASSGMSSGMIFWGITRKEITIVPKGAGGKAVTKLKIPKGNDDTDFRYVPDLSRIFPAAAKINPDFKKDKESLKLIISRVILEHGTLRARSRSDNVPVYFPNSKDFPTKDQADNFAHDTVLDLGKLERLEIHARDLDKGGVKKLVVAKGTEPCEIVCGNLCADLWLKELGGIEPYPPNPNVPVDDLDFEALYYLSYPPPKKDPLGPVPRSKNGGGGEGAKCHQAIFNPFIEE